MEKKSEVYQSQIHGGESHSSISKHKAGSSRFQSRKNTYSNAKSELLFQEVQQLTRKEPCLQSKIFKGVFCLLGLQVTNPLF